MISPLLANIYLNLVDKLVEHGMADIPEDVRIVTYADDFVLLGEPVKTFV